MAKQSAGTLLYRSTDDGYEVLVVHPSGNYNRRAPWSLPKGEPEDGEDLEAAAHRETIEETGVIPGDLVSLGHVDYTRSRKRVFAWAGPAPAGVEPWCASWEIDRAEFVDLERARELLQRDQKAFIDRLVEHLEA